MSTPTTTRGHLLKLHLLLSTHQWAANDTPSPTRMMCPECAQFQPSEAALTHEGHMLDCGIAIALREARAHLDATAPTSVDPRPHVVYSGGRYLRVLPTTMWQWVDDARLATPFPTYDDALNYLGGEISRGTLARVLPAPLTTETSDAPRPEALR